MKSTNGKTKEFDTVKTSRKIKNKISNDIKNMSYEEFRAYLDQIKSAALTKS